MSVYIAAPYPKKDEAAKLMHFLEEHQIKITSSWLWGTDDMNEYYARRCLADVCAADALIAYNWAGLGSGCHVELGYALAKNKRIILFGERTNIFHHL